MSFDETFELSVMTDEMLIFKESDFQSGAIFQALAQFTLRTALVANILGKLQCDRE